ncbi:hypothetical protein DYBT9275_03451 [Dyadobacter sp. CECT 9275]|uniref:Putative auto-transporter adhesin head GIN domain-containing protein n=1 Tax=Dyadobacter helix TaxID=2822344 RepID=A0A916JDJ9_9BACT|nr:head GIN domain-containing protein [Dyadobacter sp. CECT 9275]CAG5004803.1 hypothetical protein DYBT9275_03451 [Dyadobacter sp. CECT 9275]
MKTLFSNLIAGALLISSLQSCVYVDSDGVPPRSTSTRTFDFRDFDRLEMGSAYRVHVNYGSEFSVSATGEQKDLDDLDIFVQNHELVVRYKDTWFSDRRRMDIDITMPDLYAVDFSGAVKSDIEDFENLNELKIRLTGASKLEFDGTAKSIDIDVSGASDLYLSGEGRYLDGELSGASRLNSLDYPVEESELNLSGASDARVWVTKLLDVDVSGASSLRYKGDPLVQKEVSGGSTVKRE